MILKIILIAIISTVNSQFYPVTIPCNQGGSPVALQPLYAKVRVPSTSLALSPRVVLPNVNALPKQFSPIEYSVIGPSLTSPKLSEPCYSLLPVPEYLLTDYTNDCVSEPVFDILGCLDPVLTRYGTISEVLVPEIPQNPLISPFLPAASPVSPLAPPVSALLPPALPSQCSCHFLKKVAIPPPFI